MAKVPIVLGEVHAPKYWDMVVVTVGKRHADVMRAVVKLSSELPAEERERNFALTFFSVLGPKVRGREGGGAHLLTARPL
jgi:hypothetical protein